jgi:hypothetical protein
VIASNNYSRISDKMGFTIINRFFERYLLSGLMVAFNSYLPHS